MNSETPTVETLTPDTRIDDLVKAWPFLVDALADISPRFKALKNPVMRSTIGKVATLKMAAMMGSIPYDTLAASIAATVREKTGEELPVMTAEPSIEEDEKLEALKAIILSLHAGQDVEQARERFEEMFRDVSASEIARMEQQLIQQGLPAESIKELCDVHVGVFRDTLDRQERPEAKPGHPVHTFLAENREIHKVVEDMRGILGEGDGHPDPVRHADAWGRLRERIDDLAEVKKHYLRKENLLFPFLDQQDFTGPSQVMWAIHDDIRGQIKQIIRALDEGDADAVAEQLPRLLTDIDEMIYKEESILFPTATEMLEHDHWRQIRKGEDDIGYAFVTPGDEWNPRIKFRQPGQEKAESAEDKTNQGDTMDKVSLGTGTLTQKQLDLILKHLPVELSFVDENDKVRYYTEVEEKFFPRSPGAIGLDVRQCHPPKSLHLVEKILEEMKAGTRDTAQFWMDNFKGRFVFIRYDAVRDEDGTYMGCLEAVQDITDLRPLEGSRRLLDEEK